MGEFPLSWREAQNFKFYLFALCKRQIPRTKNWESSLLSWHWSAMKSFSTIWIVAKDTLFIFYIFICQEEKKKGLGVLSCLLSAASKTFGNWNLRNHKLDVNKACLIYVPPQHLSFPKKWGHQWLGGGGGASKNPPKNAQKFTKCRL